MKTQTTTSFAATTIGVLMTAVFGIVGNLESTTPVPHHERMALIALYEGTNGAEWSNDTNCNWRTPDGADFNLPGTECTWHGVTCDRSPSVVMIDLHDRNLSGPIPREIADLSSLVFLRLTSNRLTGSIPTELGYLTDLQYLWLSSNKLSGPIPQELGTMKSLTWLKVNDNDLSGSIPPELGSLIRLQYLGLSGNRLAGPIPPEIGRLTSLLQLELDSNRFSGLVPSEITNLTKLKRRSGLSLRWNAIYTDEDWVDRFIDKKHNWWGDWQATQTVAPENLQVSEIRNVTAWLAWDVDTGDTEPGGYEVFYAPSGSDEWISAGWTWDKTETRFPVTGLHPGTTYDFAVRTFTEPNENNKNEVYSDLSAPVSRMTDQMNLCPAPVVTVNGTEERGVILSVENVFDDHLWNTGETTATITVDPQRTGWYWVSVSDRGFCEETGSVFVSSAPPRNRQ